jgi:uncharacterized protein YjlB
VFNKVKLKAIFHYHRFACAADDVLKICSRGRVGLLKLQFDPRFIRNSAF